MSCLEFRRQLATDPAHLDATMRRHQAGCATCDRAAREALALERSLAEALSSEPPGALAEQLRGIAASGPGGPRRWQVLAGAAAAVLVCAAIGLAWSARLPAPAASLPGLDAAIVAHVRDEFWTLTATAQIDARELDGTLTTIGLGLAEHVENVRFAANCVIRGKTAAHWVIDGERAPVTVLVMPDERPNALAAIRSGSLEGLLLPVRGGSIALVGTRGEQLHKLGRRILRAVDWSA